MQKQKDQTCKQKTKKRSRVNYYNMRQAQDPFSDTSLSNPINWDQHDAVVLAIKGIVQQAIESEMYSSDTAKRLCLELNHVRFFTACMSPRSPAKIPRLEVGHLSNVMPMSVRNRMIFQNQDFSAGIVSKLIDAGMVFSYPTSPWASAPFLVPALVPNIIRVTVDLSPAKRYTVKKQVFCARK